MVRNLQIAKIFSLATFSAAIFLSPPVNAQQQSDSFSTCFNNLSETFSSGGLSEALAYGYALNQCKDLFVGQSPNESFSTCFGTLSPAFTSGYALDQCKDLFVGQSPNESFSTCFSNLSAAFSSGNSSAAFSSGYALDHCKDVFSGQSPNESFSSCFDTLSAAFSSSYAIDQCKGVFAGQSSNESFSSCFDTLSAAFPSGYANQQCRELTQNSGNSSDNRVFRIVNNTGATVDALYLSPSGSSGWGPNDLNGVLPSGNFIELTLESSSCAYDLYADLSNDQQVIERQLNTCDYTGYRLR